MQLLVEHVEGYGGGDSFFREWSDGDSCHEIVGECDE